MGWGWEAGQAARKDSMPLLQYSLPWLSVGPLSPEKPSTLLTLGIRTTIIDQKDGGAARAQDFGYILGQVAFCRLIRRPST